MTWSSRWKSDIYDSSTPCRFEEQIKRKGPRTGVHQRAATVIVARGAIPRRDERRGECHGQRGDVKERGSFNLHFRDEGLTV